MLCGSRSTASARWRILSTDRRSGPRTPRRSFEETIMKLRTLIAALFALIACAGTALAQAYPTRAVRIIVPFGPGGPADIYARFVAQHLQERLGQAFVVENRPGGGAVNGTLAAAQAAPDGYTLLMMS